MTVKHMDGAGIPVTAAGGGVGDILGALTADPSADPGYGKADRHRDFARLFLATEQGRRVFAQMMTMGRLFGPCHNPDAGAERNAFEAGRRDLALQIFDIVNVIPETPHE